ncbi:MAG: xanthine dehydrogenase accessory protein XdhC [Alphaproteobacteria bacterium]|nr:xanthine dehydrogenase accessory protein XdhC [Alphaproteobacteria bacterium]
MGFDLAQLTQAVGRHGRVARIVVSGTKGSVPRDQGAAMLVWQGGQSGTIGGGTLEFQAVKSAREALGSDAHWQRHQTRFPLGPALGQCCGGSVTLLTELFGEVECRAIEALAKSGDMFTRALASGHAPDTQTAGNLMSEQFTKTATPLWIYGAGHVGRALVNILPALGYDITWVDTGSERFPDTLPEGVAPLVSTNPAAAVAYAPHDAEHLVLTYSHAYDLDICHQILSHSFASAGLIGSATKWARFQKRLQNLGHTSAQIARITCPIGMPELGKSPQAIAVGVAATLLRQQTTRKSRPEPAKECAS